MKIPTSAANPRPHWQPYYIESYCECGTHLELFDESSPIWWDEWHCPSCRDGIYLDWPDGAVENMVAQGMMDILNGNTATFDELVAVSTD